MKAIIQDTYGSRDDVLQLKDIEKPLVKDDEVLGTGSCGLHAWRYQSPEQLRIWPAAPETSRRLRQDRDWVCNRRSRGGPQLIWGVNKGKTIRRRERS